MRARWKGVALRAAIITSLCFVRPRSRETSEPFIAFADDFTNFATWRSWSPSFGVMGDSHLNGPRRIYFSRTPIDRTFPVGTLIVKESHVDKVKSERKVFAMVKRGDSFNPDGAQGWEWFELQNVDERHVTITWRGTGPTNGDAYGGDPTGGCNSCHGSARAFDYVYSLQVRALSRGERL